jgi:hypothetical protein
MTLHSAKGLEFSDVFIVGLEEGILPHARSIETRPGIHWPRSGGCSIVGITRARQRLTLSCCKRVGGAAVAIDCLPSRYLKEIPAELLQVLANAPERAPEESEQIKQNFFAQIEADAAARIDPHNGRPHDQKTASPIAAGLTPAVFMQHLTRNSAHRIQHSSRFSLGLGTVATTGILHLPWLGCGAERIDDSCGDGARSMGTTRNSAKLFG